MNVAGVLVEGAFYKVQSVQVLAHKTWFKAAEAKHILKDENLTVYVEAGTDSDCRDGNFFRDALCKGSRNTFKKDTEASKFFGFFCFALRQGYRRLY